MSLCGHCAAIVSSSGEREGWLPHRSGLEHFQPGAQVRESSDKSNTDILSQGVGGLQEFSLRSLEISL